MRHHSPSISDPLRIVGGSIAMMLVAANVAWCQLDVPVLDTATEAVNSVQDAAQDVTGATQGTVQDVTGTAQDTLDTTTGAAQDAVRGTTGTVQDSVRGGTNSARDVTEGTLDRTRQTTRGATDATRDTTGRTRNTTQGAQRGVTDTVRETTRGARGTVRDATRDASDVIDDAGQRATGAARRTQRRVQDATEGASLDARTETEASTRIQASDQTRGTRGDVLYSQLRGPDLGVWFDRSARNGLIIADVAANAALSQFGFMEGDRIVSVMNQPVRTEADFVRYLVSDDVQNEVEVVVMRDGQEEIVVLDPLVIREQLAVVQTDPLEQFGVILDDRQSDRVVVWRVMPRSPAFYAGIRAGDVIDMFAGQQVSGPDELVDIVATIEPGVVPVQVIRNNRLRTIEADFPAFQAAERQTSFRQDLDVDAGARLQTDDAGGSSSAVGDVDADVGAGVQGQAGPVRGEASVGGELDTDTRLPGAPNSADSGQGSVSGQIESSGSGSVAPRRIIPRIRRR